MIDFLYSIDRAVFQFINVTLSNPVGDLLWPLITNYDRFLTVRIVVVCVWLWLMIKGGVRGRTAGLLLIAVLFASDKLCNDVIKVLVNRPRPCHDVNGMHVVEPIHLLVGCGPGKSFPSSHAMNNFAVATLFAFYYRRGLWAFAAWASLVALSRPAVGVHYPSDILAGALLGIAVAAGILWIWTMLQRRFFPRFAVVEPDKGGP